jgi:hypothetical protein
MKIVLIMITGGVTNAPLNYQSHIGKILVRNGQRPPTGGDYILESDLPLPYRIMGQGRSSLQITLSLRVSECLYIHPLVAAVL